MIGGPPCQMHGEASQNEGYTPQVQPERLEALCSKRGAFFLERTLVDRAGAEAAILARGGFRRVRRARLVPAEKAVRPLQQCRLVYEDVRLLRNLTWLLQAASDVG
jgi:hypothetical protein